MLGTPKIPKPGQPPTPPAGAPKLGSAPLAPTTAIKNPMKTGSQATVKMPKAKSMPDPFGKPSLFFKSEDFNKIKKPSIEKLRAFLESTRKKRNLK